MTRFGIRSQNFQISKKVGIAHLLFLPIDECWALPNDQKKLM